MTEETENNFNEPIDAKNEDTPSSGGTQKINKDIKINSICKVIKTYKRKEEKELDINEGESVRVLNIQDKWITVQKCFEKDSEQPQNLSLSHECGLVPQHHLRLLYKVKSNLLNLDIGSIVEIIEDKDSQFAVLTICCKLSGKLMVNRYHEDFLRDTTEPFEYVEKSTKIKVEVKKKWKLREWLTHNKQLFCYAFLAPVLIALIIFSINYYIGRSESESSDVKELLDSKLKTFLEENPILSSSDDDTLFHCLEKTVKNEKPCIILILNGDEIYYSNLLLSIGTLGVEVLNNQNKSSHAKLIYVNGSHLSKYHNNEGVYKEHKEKLEIMKVMLVDEMEKIPGYIMETFHSLCDVYNPAVKQAIIIFLLNFNSTDFDLQEVDATLAQNILHKIWEGSIKQDLISPLANRVSENIIRLTIK